MDSTYGYNLDHDEYRRWLNDQDEPTGYRERVRTYLSAGHPAGTVVELCGPRGTLLDRWTTSSADEARKL